MLGLRVPRLAFFFSGFGESEFHPIEAFDNALLSSGVHEFNLVYYSSILPAGIEFVDKMPQLPRGTELPVVLSVINGHKGEFLAAALGRALDRRRGGIVVETHARGENEENLLMAKERVTLDEFLERTLELVRRLMRARGLSIDEEGIVHAEGLVRKTYGSAVAGVAFVEFRYL